MCNIEETNNKHCSDCVYHKNTKDCIRKREKVSNSDVCFHYVALYERHSLDKLISMIAELFDDEET